MESEHLLGKKVRFGKHNWTIIEWNCSGCKLICDVLEGDNFFLGAWDRTYRLDRGEDVFWPKCELHDWLNDDFIKSSFSEEEAACIISEACSINAFDSDQIGVFLLNRQELMVYTNIDVNNCWTLDTEIYFYGEDEVTYEKYIQPVIWIDFSLVKSLIPGWKELTEVLAYSDNNDWGIPNPI